MDENTTESNEFVIPEFAGYAGIDLVRCAVAEFLMTEFQDIEIEDLDPDDRVCIICQEEFSFSEDPKLSHTPVKTSCGHIFGDNCLMMWLETFYAWSNSDPDPDRDGNDTPIRMSNAGCPHCRYVFVPAILKASVEELGHCILFWDQAYANAGVTRTENEKRCRDAIVLYINYYCAANEREPLHMKLAWRLDCSAQKALLEFTRHQKYQTLTPEQENRRIRLERIARKDLLECLEFEDGEYKFVFDINSDDDERDEFEGNPMEKAILDADNELPQPAERRLDNFRFQVFF